MAILPFQITEEDMTKPESAWKFNEIFRRLSLEPNNVPDNFITQNMIDNSTNDLINTEWDVLTTGESTGPDLDNIGVINLEIIDAILPTIKPAVLDETEIIRKLLFNDSDTSSASWTFRLPEDFNSTLKLNLMFNTVDNSSDVTLNAYIMKMTPGTDDPFTPSFGSANVITEPTQAVSGILNFKQTILTHTDSMVAGDEILLKIERVAPDAITGDVALLGVSLQYYKPLGTQLIFSEGDIILVETITA